MNPSIALRPFRLDLDSELQFVMLLADIYKPDQWRDFFVMVGTGSAALTGLVFVAMSLNPSVIFHDATHRYRAIGTLAGFTAVFITCALALMGGQDHRAIAVEWLTVAIVAAIVYVNGYFLAVRRGGSEEARSLGRVIGGTVCYLAEIAGAIILLSGHIAGLYISAIAMVVYFYWMISGAWLLILGVQQQTRN